jgi:hypothetical protein
VSAQIVSALYDRARILDAEAKDLADQGLTEDLHVPGRTVDNLRFLAEEFRKLGRNAEAP